MRVTPLVAILVSILMVSGCQRTYYGSFGSPYPSGQIIAQPQPLSPAPVGGVETGQLPGPNGPNSANLPDGTFPTAPGQEVVGVDGAAADQNLDQLATLSQDVNKEEMLGGWTLASGAQSCDVFLSLTQWTGGYRAASRGCVDGLALVSAWNVEGKQVILADSTGANVASLYKTASERFDGSTLSGQPISMGR